MPSLDNGNNFLQCESKLNGFGNDASECEERKRGSFTNTDDIDDRELSNITQARQLELILLFSHIIKIFDFSNGIDALEWLDSGESTLSWRTSTEPSPLSPWLTNQYYSVYQFFSNKLLCVFRLQREY